MHYEEEYGEYGEEEYGGEEYEYEEEEGAFMAEASVFERVEYENGDTLERIAMDAGVIPETRKKHEGFANKKWKFYVYVNATARRLIEEGVIPNVSVREIPHILRQIEWIDNPEYKNPTGFVVGYSASKGGIVDGKVVGAIIKRLANSGSTDLKATDILRYARLWLDSNEKLRG